MLPNRLFNLKPEFAKELGVPANFSTTNTSVLVVVGSNASGKSFLRRYVQASLREKNVEVLALSHELRTKGGMMSAFVYGDEAWQSTGAITAGTFLAGVKTMKTRDHSHVVIWDEPEIGMGEELQVGCADWLFASLKPWPKLLLGIILLTHSRFWARRAMACPKARFLSLDGHPTLDDWLNREIKPMDPETLTRHAGEKFRRLNQMLDQEKAR